MKKVLFATTALVASAGIASAQGVTLTGSAEMGIVGGDNMDTQFWHDLDVKFTLSGETDNGLTFGATVDLDEIGDDACNLGQTGNPAPGACVEEHSVFISGAFGTLTLGDTDGAFDWALQEIDAVGDISDASTGHAGFSGNAGLDGFYDGQIARYDYTFGAFSFAVSAEMDDRQNNNDPIFGIGGKYTGDFGAVAIGFGIGYQTVDMAGTQSEVIGASVDAKYAGFRLIANYSDFDNVTRTDGSVGVVARPIDSHYGIGAFYETGAISFGANYGVYEAAAGNLEGYGVAANYDLGGGAVLKAGYGYGEDKAAGGADASRFSFGLSMAF
jgi:outer membrane protein OmpU